MSFVRIISYCTLLANKLWNLLSLGLTTYLLTYLFITYCVVNLVQNGADSADELRLSQYDMAVVQAGFIGPMISHPELFGASETDLEHYVFLWRCIGYLLGIDDRYNVCSSGLESARAIYRQVWNGLVLPGLHEPTAHFHQMTDAYIGGLNSLLPGGQWWRPVSKESTISFTLQCWSAAAAVSDNGDPPDWLWQIGWTDRLRVRVMKINVWMMRHIGAYRWLLNRILNRIVLPMWLPIVQRRLLAVPGLNQVDTAPGYNSAIAAACPIGIRRV